MNLTTDFGQIEQVIQQKIDQNRGKVRVAADLSRKGIAEIEAEERMQTALAEEALTNFEVELGLKSPETTPVAADREGPGPGRDATRPSRSRRTDRGSSDPTADIALRIKRRFSAAWRTDSRDQRSTSQSLSWSLGLVGLAIWRYGGGSGARHGQSSRATS